MRFSISTLVLAFIVFFPSLLFGQQAVVSSFSNATGSGGSMQSSVGQVGYEHYSGANRNLQFGLQQIFGTENETITIDLFPAEGGDIIGQGSYVIGSLVTLHAQPKPGFQFVRWVGNFTPAGAGKSIYASTDNPIVIQILSNTQITAEFESVPIVPLSGVLIYLLMASIMLFFIFRKRASSMKFLKDL